MPDSPSDAPLPEGIVKTTIPLTAVPTDKAEPEYAAAVALYAAIIPRRAVMTAGPED